MGVTKEIIWSFLLMNHLITAQGAQAQLIHPGHPAQHVMRLHRYEHTGMQSFLEAEAKWRNEVNEIQRAASGNLKDVHRFRGSSLSEGTEQNRHEAIAEKRFVAVSNVQAKALQDHHEEWQSWLQTAQLQSSLLNQSTNASQGQGTKAAATAALLRKFKAYFNQYHKEHAESASATRLSSVGSQYIGEVGVGTVVDPICASSLTEESTPVETDSSMLGQIGAFASGMLSKRSSHGSNGSSSSTRSCRMNDQAKIRVVFDTGSTNIWIPGKDCQSAACQLPGRHLFDPTASSTFAYPDDRTQLSISFGTGHITGPMVVDDLHIGPFLVAKQNFGLMETVDGDVFSESPVEGLAGLGLDAMSANGVRPFFRNVIDQKALANNEFAFYFSKDNPTANALLWGGVDKKFYTGNLTYFPVVDPYYWALKLVNFKIGDHVVLDGTGADGASTLLQTKAERKALRHKRRRNSSRTWFGPVAIVDTGTTFNTLEDDKYSMVNDLLPAGPCAELTSSSHPPITITLENAHGQAQDFVMTNDQYMVGGRGEANCRPAFMRINIPKAHGPGMILGEIFLRSFFGVFNRDNGVDADARVAFAKSNHDLETLAHLQQLTAGQNGFLRDGSTVQ